MHISLVQESKISIRYHRHQLLKVVFVNFWMVPLTDSLLLGFVTELEWHYNHIICIYFVQTYTYTYRYMKSLHISYYTYLDSGSNLTAQTSFTLSGQKREVQDDISQVSVLSHHPWVLFIDTRLTNPCCFVPLRRTTWWR